METKLTTAQHTERYRLSTNNEKGLLLYTSKWFDSKAEVIELAKKRAKFYSFPVTMYIEKEIYIVSYEKI